MSVGNYSYGFLPMRSHAEFLFRVDVFCRHDLTRAWISSSSWHCIDVQRFQGPTPTNVKAQPQTTANLWGQKGDKGGTGHFRDLSKAQNIWLARFRHYITGWSCSGSNFLLLWTSCTNPPATHLSLRHRCDNPSALLPSTNTLLKHPKSLSANFCLCSRCQIYFKEIKHERLCFLISLGGSVLVKKTAVSCYHFHKIIQSSVDFHLLHLPSAQSAQSSNLKCLSTEANYSVISINSRVTMCEHTNQSITTFQFFLCIRSATVGMELHSTTKADVLPLFWIWNGLALFSISW